MYEYIFIAEVKFGFFFYSRIIFGQNIFLHPKMLIYTNKRENDRVDLIFFQWPIFLY